MKEGSGTDACRVIVRGKEAGGRTQRGWGWVEGQIGGTLDMESRLFTEDKHSRNVAEIILQSILMMGAPFWDARLKRCSFNRGQQGELQCHSLSVMNI